MPTSLSRTYPLAPAIDEVVAAIAERRRRVAYPRWFRRRSPSASCSPRRSPSAGGKAVPEAMREYEQMVAERGASAASATERTRELAGL